MQFSSLLIYRKNSLLFRINDSVILSLELMTRSQMIAKLRLNAANIRQISLSHKSKAESERDFGIKALISLKE